MFTTYKKEMLLDDTWDVVVVGGGPAGCAAAAAAAREGIKTLLIESTGCLGGMATSGLVPAWCPFTDGERIIYNGIARKIFETNKAGIRHISPEAIHGWLPIDPEALKRNYDDLVTAYGVKVLFNTRLIDVEMQDKSTIASIICSNKSGLIAYKAKVYVDCTGDGDLACWAGAEYKKGNDLTGELQPATLCFILSNVDSYSFLTGKAATNNVETGNWVYEGSPTFKIVNKQKYPDISDSHLCGNLIGPGTIGFNAGHIFNVDSTNADNVSSALIEGRKIAKAIRDALSENEPETFGNAYLVASAASMGIRESRRIIGDYILTVDDYLARRSFEDEISRNSYKIDIHQSQEQATKTDSYEGFMKFEEDNETYRGSYMRYKNGESHGIPYRCLTPKGISNVLVAGRCISIDKRVQGSIRVMPVCLSTGEAAGIAAALAVQYSHNDVHTVNTDHLRRRILEEGGYLK